MSGFTRTPTRLSVTIEIVSAMMMATVAVATAWSGYQGARWSGVQAADFASAAAKRTEASVVAIRAGQGGLLDALLFNDWLTATLSGNAVQAALDEKRFRPEFAPVFQAWLATSPLKNPAAPSSPFALPDYQQPKDISAQQKEAEAASLFAAGQAANQQSDDYILTTVVLASVMFFLALSQRFENFRVRVCLNVFAFVMLISALYQLWTFPVH